MLVCLLVIIVARDETMPHLNSQVALMLVMAGIGATTPGKSAHTQQCKPYSRKMDSFHSLHPAVVQADEVNIHNTT